MKALLIGALALTALAPAALAQTAKPASQCFASSQIDNTRVVDDSTINFAVRGRVYQAKMFAPCARLKDGQGGYTMTLRGGNMICSALDLDIGVNELGGSKCLAESLRQLTPAEVAALPAKEKP